jgi:hypothetical protein
MPFFLSTKGLPYNELSRRLYEAVKRGDVRSMLNDVIIPKAHIGAYLTLYTYATPDQEPHTLPPNVQLSYDDLCAVFDRPVIDKRKRGRPVKENTSVDRQLAFEMHMMLAGYPRHQQASSAAEAARILVALGRVPGAGTPQSRAKRLERVFRKYYSS